MDENKMRIAYFTTVYPSVSHTFIRRELREIERRGHTLFRIALRQPEMELVDEGDLEEAPKTFYCLSRSKFKIIGEILWILLTGPLAFFRALNVALAMGRKSEVGLLKHIAYLLEACIITVFSRRNSIDHIHVHFGTNVTAVARLVKYLGGPTYSFTVHGPAEFDAPSGFDLEGKIGDSLFTVAITNFCASQLMRWCHYSQWDKIKIIHCTVDETFSSNGTELDEESRVFVNVGRLSAQKGTFLLLHAFHKLLSQGVQAHLVLVGDGELREQVEELMDELNMRDHVTITGYVSEKEVRKQINKARVMVMPSFAEGLPMVIMEAYALGRPVISTYIAGIPELINNENGWLIPAGSIEALTKIMKAAFECDSSVIKEKAARGREAVLKEHNTQIEGEKLEELFFRYIIKKKDI
jgi:colanic acid/amylovoran biosynthesis glycosyltransferase